MPKTIYLPADTGTTLSMFTAQCSSGIDITWTPTSRKLSIGGWYDHCVGIESTDMTLGAFFRALGITAKDCKRALSEGE